MAAGMLESGSHFGAVGLPKHKTSLYICSNQTLKPPIFTRSLSGHQKTTQSFQRARWHMWTWLACILTPSVALNNVEKMFILQIFWGAGGAALNQVHSQGENNEVCRCPEEKVGAGSRKWGLCQRGRENRSALQTNVRSWEGEAGQQDFFNTGNTNGVTGVITTKSSY